MSRKAVHVNLRRIKCKLLQIGIEKREGSRYNNNVKIYQEGLYENIFKGTVI